MFQEFEEASQKAISTKDNIYIYILPVGLFPKGLRIPIEHGSVPTVELIRRFVSCYSFRMTVKFLDQIAVTEVNCKQRFQILENCSS